MDCELSKIQLCRRVSIHGHVEAQAAMFLPSKGSMRYLCEMWSITEPKRHDYRIRALWFVSSWHFLFDHPIVVTHIYVTSTDSFF